MNNLNRNYNYNMRPFYYSNNPHNIYYPQKLRRVYYPYSIQNKKSNLQRRNHNEEDNVNTNNNDKNNISNNNQNDTNIKNDKSPNSSKSNPGKKKFSQKQLYKQLCKQYPDLSIKEIATIFGILTGSLKVSGVLLTTDKLLQVILRGSIDLCPKPLKDLKDRKMLEDLDLDTIIQLFQNGGLT